MSARFHVCTVYKTDTRTLQNAVESFISPWQMPSLWYVLSPAEASV